METNQARLIIQKKHEVKFLTGNPNHTKTYQSIRLGTLHIVLGQLFFCQKKKNWNVLGFASNDCALAC